MSLEQHLIQVVNLVFFIATSIAAIWMNIRHKTIDYKMALTIIICGIIGAIVGSLISFRIDNQNLKKYFGIFLILIAIFQIYMYVKKENSKN